MQAAALEPQLTAPQGKRVTKVPLDVLQVGSGVGRWTSSFDLTKTRFVGIDVRKDLTRTARANFLDQATDSKGDTSFAFDRGVPEEGNVRVTATGQEGGIASEFSPLLKATRR